VTFTKILVIAAVLGILAGCNSSSQNDPGTTSSTDAPSTVASVLLAGGGIGTTDSGSGGGFVDLESYGPVNVLKSGTVDASFPDPAFTPDFGTIHAVVSSDTTVLLDDDAISGNLCSAPGDNNLYIGDGNSTCGDLGDSIVTGLTVNAGASLKLVQDLQLPSDLVIYGTVTIDPTQTSSLYIEANVIDVEKSGKITVSGTDDTYPDAGELDLGGNGTTKQIINRGTIEAKGFGSGAAGNGGYIYFEPEDLVVNYGTIDASGGSSATGDGGYGGELDVYVDYGDFYSSGNVLMNGGNGVSGGDTEPNVGNFSSYSVYVETAYYDNNMGRNGDIIISGTWEAKGGDGNAGNGGAGGYIYLQTDAVGAVTINAAMSTKGGNGTGTNSTAGDSYGIDIYSENYDSVDPASPGKIRIAGQYDLRGGDGDQTGGWGGYFEIYGDGYNNTSFIGSEVNLVGFPAINLNAGDGGQNGGDGGYFEIYTYSAGIPAGAITNETNVEAKGGNATGTGGGGGSGGYAELLTDSSNADPATTVSNSGNIDVSGGTGDTGGDGYDISMEAQYVNNSGNLTADGGNGITNGGSGGDISLNSDMSPTSNYGTLSAQGGAGPTSGGSGTITIDGTQIWP
jgi:hypothetical protein